jgi:hypothetical protein
MVAGMTDAMDEASWAIWDRSRVAALEEAARICEDRARRLRTAASPAIRDKAAGADSAAWWIRRAKGIGR